MEICNCYNFLFHPLEETHTEETQKWAVITDVALSILSCGLFLILFSLIRTAEWLFEPKKEVVDLTGVTIVEARAPPVQHVPAKTLEESFGALTLERTPCKFQDYRTPNEWSVSKGMPPHLQGLKGWIVSTGTERSLFDLLLAPQECEGLIVRDIKWEVKAYIDCIVMILRLSNDFATFQELINPSKHTREEKQGLLLQKLTASQLPEAVKRYYQANLPFILKGYFEAAHIRSFDWPSNTQNSVLPDELRGLDYRLDAALFNKLKRYADNGKIIATLGDIGDLEQIAKQVRIGLIDTSNIEHYTQIDIRVGNQRPKIVWVIDQGSAASYHSYTHRALSNEERRELNLLIKRFHEATQTQDLINLSNAINFANFGKNKHFCTAYSFEFLGEVRSYSRFIYEFRGTFVNFEQIFNSEERLYQTFPNDFEAIGKDPAFTPFIPFLIENIAYMFSSVDQKRIALLKEVPNWPHYVHEAIKADPKILPKLRGKDEDLDSTLNNLELFAQLF